MVERRRCAVVQLRITSFALPSVREAVKVAYNITLMHGCALQERLGYCEISWQRHCQRPGMLEQAPERGRHCCSAASAALMEAAGSVQLKRTSQAAHGILSMAKYARSLEGVGNMTWQCDCSVQTESCKSQNKAPACVCKQMACEASGNQMLGSNRAHILRVSRRS